MELVPATSVLADEWNLKVYKKTSSIQHYPTICLCLRIPFNVHILLEFTQCRQQCSFKQVTYQTTTPPIARWLLVGVSVECWTKMTQTSVLEFPLSRSHLAPEGLQGILLGKGSHCYIIECEQLAKGEKIRCKIGQLSYPGWIPTLHPPKKTIGIFPDSYLFKLKALLAAFPHRHSSPRLSYLHFSLKRYFS